MLGVGGMVLQFSPKAKNVVVDGASARIVVVSPDLIEQFVARHHPLSVLDEKLQRLVLFCGFSLSFLKPAGVPW